jgi:NitT/TauT family transport system substrate-binding protein
MMRCIRKFRTIGVLLMAVMYIVAPYEVGAKELTEVTYSIPMTIAAIPSYVAHDQGFWEEEGLKVNLKFFSSGRQALDSVLSHSAEVMSVSETPPMHAVLQGHELFWVATVSEHRESKITVRSDRVYYPEALKGKMIGTLPGTNSDYYMYVFLNYWGLSPKDVKITSMKPPHMVTAFVAGEIDAFFAWEPHNYYGYSKLPGKSAVWPTDPKLYSGRHSIVMMQDVVAENPGVVEKLIKGWIKAEKFCIENPAKAQSIVAKTLKMDMAPLQALWGEYIVKVQLDNGLYELLQKEGRWGLDIKGKTKSTIPEFKDYIYTDALMKIRPESVGSVFK